jgi:hypothetical protein
VTHTNVIVNKNTVDNPEVIAAFEKLDEAASDAYSEQLIPFISKLSGYKAKGKINALTSFINGSRRITLKMEFDAPPTDMFEEAQRYIFLEFLRMAIEREANRI